MILGVVIGIFLALRKRITVQVIGIPESGFWEVVTVFISAGTCANLGSFIGAWFDIVFGPWTIFDGMRELYLKCKG